MKKNLDKVCQENSTSALNATRQVVSELENVYQNHYDMSFTDSLTKMPGSGIQTKPTSSEKKTKKRKLQRDCRDHISSQMQKTDTLTVLAEGQSIASYKRMRLSQSFSTPTKAKKKQKKKHAKF